MPPTTWPASAAECGARAHARATSIPAHDEIATAPTRPAADVAGTGLRHHDIEVRVTVARGREKQAFGEGEAALAIMTSPLATLVPSQQRGSSHIFGSNEGCAVT